MYPELLIICGPSGAGKGSVISQLMQDERFYLSRSVTTRQPRPTEQRGVHYDYITLDEFLARRDAGEFCESNIYNTSGYATPAQPVEQALAAGKTVVLDIDINGARQIAEHYAGRDVKCVFLVPDSLNNLRRRLLDRGDDPADVERRLTHAAAEYRMVANGLPFISAIVLNPNGELTQAVQTIRRMIDTGVWDENRMDLVQAAAAE